MLEIYGRYDFTIDDKGRFLLPAAFRKQLPEISRDRFVMNCGFDHSLNFFTEITWAKVAAKYARLNEMDPTQRKLKQLFMHGVTTLEVDKAGRLMLPKYLLEYSHIEKDVVFTAQGNQFKLWDKTTYTNFISAEAGNYEEYAAKVAADTGGAFNPFEFD